MRQRIFVKAMQSKKINEDEIVSCVHRLNQSIRHQFLLFSFIANDLTIIQMAITDHFATIQTLF